MLQEKTPAMSAFRWGVNVIVVMVWMSLSIGPSGGTAAPSEASDPCQLSPCRHRVSKCAKTAVFPFYICTDIKSGHLEANPRPAMVLSLDGGGSKGIMELKMLEDVMKILSLLVEAPESLTNHLELANKTNRQSYRDFLDNDIINGLDQHGKTKIIHPTEVFDMIAGTSTGGLIAYALVGGNKLEDGSRSLMNVKEVTKMYIELVDRIFKPDHPELNHCNRFCKAVSKFDVCKVVNNMNLNTWNKLVDTLVDTLGYSGSQAKILQPLCRYLYWSSAVENKIHQSLFTACTDYCENKLDLMAKYDNDGLILLLKTTFGDTNLGQMSKDSPSCIALAVTTPINSNLGGFQIFEDITQILSYNFTHFHHASFNTFMTNKQGPGAQDKDEVLVSNVLLATSAAPTVLPIPIHMPSRADVDADVIGYVDGGVGANCPVREALKRIKEILSKEQTDKVAVISLAPPRCRRCGHGDEKLSNMLVNMVTDGHHDYDCVKHQNRDALLHRYAPLSEALMDYNLSDTCTEKMMADLMAESINDVRYFDGIQHAAAIILASRYTVTDERLKNGPKAAEVLFDLNRNTNCADHLHTINFTQQILEFLMVSPGSINLETLKSRKSLKLKFCKFSRAVRKCIISDSSEKQLMDHLLQLESELC